MRFSIFTFLILFTIQALQAQEKIWEFDWITITENDNGNVNRDSRKVYLNSMMAQIRADGLILQYDFNTKTFYRIEPLEMQYSKRELDKVANSTKPNKLRAKDLGEQVYVDRKPCVRKAILYPGEEKASQLWWLTKETIIPLNDFYKLAKYMELFEDTYPLLIKTGKLPIKIEVKENGIMFTHSFENMRQVDFDKREFRIRKDWREVDN